MTGSLDLRFDTIASAYDGQRALPPASAAQIGAEIAALAGAGGRVLELGVGTGRIAVPLANAGARVVGIDISPAMLDIARSRGMRALIRGDAARLPCRAAVFDAVLLVHVLHLVPEWRAALADLIAALRPGGLLLQGREWREPRSCAEQLRRELRMAVMRHNPLAGPPAAGADIAGALLELGVVSEGEQIAAEWTVRRSPAEVVRGMAARADAETWALPDELLAAVVADVQAWAAATWDDLEAPQAIDCRFIITVGRKANDE